MASLKDVTVKSKLWLLVVAFAVGIIVFGAIAYGTLSTVKINSSMYKQISLGKRESGALAALPIWMEFMEKSMAGIPPLDFPNVVTLEQQAEEHHVHTDVPDTAPEEELPAPRAIPPAALPPAPPPNPGPPPTN